MKKLYCAFFRLAKPTYEHAQLVDVISVASNGDFKQFPLPGGTGFVFASSQLPWMIDFDKILMDEDAKLVLEIGEMFAHHRFGVVATWLESHLHPSRK